MLQISSIYKLNEIVTEAHGVWELVYKFYTHRQKEVIFVSNTTTLIHSL